MKLQFFSALLCLALLAGCGAGAPPKAPSSENNQPPLTVSQSSIPAETPASSAVPSAPEDSTGLLNAPESAADAENTGDTTPEETAEPNAAPPQSDTERTESTMKIQAGDTVFTVKLEDNSSVTALMELLAEGPLTIQMHDYGNMEKVGPIGQDLPRNDRQTSTGPGDVILYQGNSLVIYYDTNSWNFTRIGKIENVTQDELLAALGSGNVSVTFSLGGQ